VVTELPPPPATWTLAFRVPQLLPACEFVVGAKDDGGGAGADLGRDELGLEELRGDGGPGGDSAAGRREGDEARVCEAEEGACRYRRERTPSSGY
jgi:hypothetical protein